MSIFQMIILAAILLLVFREFGDSIVPFVKSSIAKFNDRKRAEVPTIVKQDEVKQVQAEVAIDYPISLASIVGKWEELRKMCRKYNLKEAENKLDEVFPLLLDDEEKE